jgi:hypothetical protein
LRRLAALALGENGDPRATPVLVAWWKAERLPYPRAREVLAAFGELRPKEAALPLIASLEDLRLRPYIAETLAKIGQPAARAPLAVRFANERNKDTRAALGAALVKLGAKSELAAPLIRFMGTPDPLADGIDWARRSGLLPLMGTTEADLEQLRAQPGVPVAVRFKLPPDPADEPRYRIVARATTTDEKPGRLTFTHCPPTAGAKEGEAAAMIEFSPGPARDLFVDLPHELAPSGRAKSAREICVALSRASNLSVAGAAVVPLADDLPPPPPEPWEAVAPTPSSDLAGPPRH